MEKLDTVPYEAPGRLPRDSSSHSKVEEVETITSLVQQVDDFPDGGLKAHIVLCGVRSSKSDLRNLILSS